MSNVNELYFERPNGQHGVHERLTARETQRGETARDEREPVDYVIGEALSLLTSDQLVQRIDQRGFRVAQVSEAEFQELLRTRAWLEERALRESIAHGDTAWEEDVVLAHYHLSRTPRSVDGEPNADWESCHRNFHRALIAACGSSILLRFCDQLYDQNVRYRQLSGSKAYPKRDIAEEHNAICDSVLARDADRQMEAQFRALHNDLKAGVPSIGVITVSRPLRMPTRMPSPEKVLSWRSRMVE